MTIRGSNQEMEKIIEEAVKIVEQNLVEYKKTFDAEDEFELSREDLLLYHIEEIRLFFGDSFLLGVEHSDPRLFKEFIKNIIAVVLLNEGNFVYFGKQENPYSPRWEVEDETGVLEIYVEKKRWFSNWKNDCFYNERWKCFQFNMKGIVVF